MRVVGVLTPGGPEALEVVEVPDPPAPGPGQVKIRVHAATVNPTDTYMRNGAYRAMLPKDLEPPYVPGMDAAGVVAEVGDGVEGLAVGDRVMAIVMPTRRERGAYAEQLVLSARSVAHAPSLTSHAEAATVPMNGLTARLTLDKLQLPMGSTIAVTGAAGCYGGYVVQLAKADGLRVIADSSAEDERRVRHLGPDVVVRRGDDVAARIREIAPDGDGGAVASVRPFEGETERGIALHSIWVSEYAKAGDKLSELGRLVELGALTLRVAKTFRAEHASEAHRVLERGGTRGRLVIEL